MNNPGQVTVRARIISFYVRRWQKDVGSDGHAIEKGYLLECRSGS